MGYLTSSVSYLLIEQHVLAKKELVFWLLTHVGIAGCLCDSAIDFHHDVAKGRFVFSMPRWARFCLTYQFLTLGVRISIRFPTLVPLFFEAMFDDLRDQG